ncbi:MAG: chromosome segregation protein SMC, partial [Pirellulales bacterium]
MLKALELVGFKSFADKTRFEFPQGITTVVGPNGSGKSNVVDAIKWVLGEQSVKSLRGKEMADVIFNGSGSRHALNAAEATLTFDNPGRVLPIDTAEVHITRRVYRNGEGEYLINRQPCRLRDIRDLFSGTGVATEAYSVIEQGKVDVMLQASPRDRRAIFEEAAGISRFKAKKIETLRRLERVDQNLLRLSDIVEEVDNRLRSVRMQAAKARRYKEHTDRLQQLRTQVGLVDWRKLSARLAGLESEATALADQRDQAAGQAESLEAQALQLETALAEQAELIRASEAAHAENGREIATQEAAIQHQRARVDEAEEEVARHMRQLAAMSVKAGDLEQQLRETSAAVREADEQHAHRMAQLASREQSLAELATALAEMRAEYERDRGQCLEATRAAAALASEVQSLEAQVQAARGERSRHVERLSELDEARQALAGELNQLARRQQELVEAVDRRGGEWSRAQARLADLRHQQQARQAELARLRQRESGAAERAKLLDELEQRQEGLGAGVRQVLAEARTAADGPFRHVRGLVADLFHVSVEMAPLIEAALGEWAQYFVVSQDDELVALVERETYHFQGRVGFIRLAERDPAGWEKPVDLEGQPGVQGRADHFVDTPAELAPLARRLLGRTWIVEKLSHARALAAGMGRGLSFVTLAGEVMTADGTLSVGPRYAATGLMSRRSELRALRQQLAQLASAIRDESAALTELERQMAAEAERCQALAAEHQRAADALGEHRLRVQASQARHQQIGEQSELLTVQLDEVSQRLAAAGSRLEQSRQHLAEVEDRLCRLQAADTAIAEQMTELEMRRQQCQREATAAKVELAKSEERLSSLQTRLRQFDEDQQERRRTIAECRAQLAQCRQRARQSQQAILAAESQVAQLYLAKEGLAARTVVLINGREAQRRSRADLVAHAQAAR